MLQAAYTQAPQPISSKEITIASRLYYYRTALSITQEDLAEHIGVSTKTLKAYEDGSQDIPASTLFLLGQAMGLDHSLFYEG